MTELEQYIHSYFKISQENITKISSFFITTSLKKGDYYLKSGRICNTLSFQKSGILRVYITTETRDVTQWISTKGYFITDLAGLIFNEPSKYNLQALSDCEFYTIDKFHYEQINQHIPEWQYLEKLFIARCFTLLEERIFTLLSMTAEQRFLLLFEQHKELFNQVPLHYLASMCGMTPETFSRLRKKTM